MRHGLPVLVRCLGGRTQTHGKRRVRPDGGWPVPEAGVAPLLVEVDGL